MEVDRSILLQKQVRDNSSDLQSEFYDMKNWEEQMKRKDSELLHASGDRVLPPIRSRKKSAAKQVKPKTTENEANRKRIKSSDYTSWDKFDVDKACEELDRQEEHESSDEELSKEELEKNHNQAVAHKEKGNVFVKKQQWSQAVQSYDEAIKVFPYDAVFYANRALCHLKMDNLYSAEADCTAAIQLDELYVKAYHRRATARKELKQYKEAMEDLEKVLKLDPSNKDASKMLTLVKKKIESSKPLLVSQSDLTDDTPIEKKIGEKLCGGPVKKPQNIEPTSSVVPKPKIPCWSLGEGEDVAIIQPVMKPPHQRSKKPLRRIEVKETESRNSNIEGTVKKIEPLISEVIPVQEVEHDTVRPTNLEHVELPPVPRTTVQFFMNWKKNKDPEFRFLYLEQMPVDTIHKLFKDSMEPDTFSEILTILSTEFINRKKPLFRYLEDLAQVKRFGALTMFMSTADKNALKTIFKYCEVSEHKSQDELASLQKKYEV
ncbi:RNA polymerase II-associated protein 3 [Neodiprion lecontei]|uniref:RNA polymerase II-associated protein 3 n=1 Tax=Neodiprion lecontei TaxID=441921 RepID=A0A6J0BPZ9_NEOLC|nr:RNA polymerase II-associated protein 3 [Neodiprion lecontei]XP_046593338.1 RNA polymerase II-associated protein 3 [Neodiprion lecontei]